MNSIKKVLKPFILRIFYIYRNIQDALVKKYDDLPDVIICEDYELKSKGNYHSKEIHQNLCTKLNDDNPYFLGRIGGSDYEIINFYYNSKDIISNQKKYDKYLNIVRNYNGYFDFDNQKDNFQRYLDVMLDSYFSCDSFSYCNENIIKQFDDKKYRRDYYKLFVDLLKGKFVFDYTFFEAIEPFIQSFKVWGNKKRILFISPFSRSIEYQFERKNQLLKDYVFPDFNLLTYNSVVTYNNDNDNQESLNIKTRNWHQQCNEMMGNIAKIDFDIAFLSCGSYAMPLGRYIKETLHKKAIYLGGILNVLFNIYGKRYDTPFFNNLIDKSSQIEAFENKDIINVCGGRQTNSESIKAYFGKRGSKL